MRVRFWVLQFAVMATIVCIGFGGTAARATGSELTGLNSRGRILDGASIQHKSTSIVCEAAEQRHDVALNKVNAVLLNDDAQHPATETYNGMSTWGCASPVENFLENGFQLMGRWWYESGRYLALCIGLVSAIASAVQLKCGVSRAASVVRFNRRSFFATLYFSAFFLGFMMGFVICKVAPRGDIPLALSLCLKVMLCSN